MNLSFELNPYFLAYYTIANSSSSRFISGMANPDVVAFQNRAWSINKESYKLTREVNFFPLLTKKVFEQGELQKQLLVADSFLKEIMKDTTFEVIVRQTNTALVSLRHKWEAQLFKSTAALALITRLEDPTKEVNSNKVFVIHPSQRPSNKTNQKLICTISGTTEETLFELWFYLLMRIIPVSNKGDGMEKDRIWVKELVCRFVVAELRAILSKTSYPPFVSIQNDEDWDYADKELKELCPLWKDYLDCKSDWKTKNINDFTNELTIERLSHYKKHKEQS